MKKAKQINNAKQAEQTAPSLKQRVKQRIVRRAIQLPHYLLLYIGTLVPITAALKIITLGWRWLKRCFHIHQFYLPHLTALIISLIFWAGLGIVGFAANDAAQVLYPRSADEHQIEQRLRRFVGTVITGLVLLGVALLISLITQTK
ncbi:hypothetical protein ACI3E1_07155 [Ligilactobacillus sp. LYQ139]|uniref:hypothetical protein n=1 Tax=Ligilactobacillus sp. LYQ139 TaxID=3378800 RepID=UPI0038520936